MQVDETTAHGKPFKATIIFLHGATGVMKQGAFENLSNIGEDYLACSGYRVLLPHYLDLSKLSSVMDMEAIRKNGPVWLSGVSEFIEAQPLNKPIFIYGQSLGSFLAVEFLRSHADRVAAASLLSFGYLDSLPAPDTDLPPMLLQHGMEDTIVPFAAFQRFVKGYKDQSRLTSVVYPALGHNLYFESGGMVTVVTRRFFDCAMNSKELLPCPS